jgi:outer membrane protein insertion porin family
LADIRDINYFAAQEIKDQEGQSTTSSLMGMIRRDTRNHFFTPTDGSNNWFSAEVAGGIMGGTNAYYRLIGNSGWYFPLWWESWTFYVRAKAGVMFEGPGDLPVYEKFYLGGIKSVRGFEWGDIGPRDPVTGDYIGGQSMFQLNMEVGFPLFEDAGISGVVFFDQGNAWEDPGDIDPTDLKRSVGAGFRYLSPFGPMRIEYGWVINPDERDPNGNWEFAVGGQF